MTKKCSHQKVTEKELLGNIDELRQAAREGRLYLVPKSEEVSRKAVVNNVRTYVKGIETFASKPFKDKVGLVWEEVFKQEVFVDMLMPNPKQKKCRLFNKYTVMRIVGIMREHGVYDERYTARKISAALEGVSHEESYHSFLSRGFKHKKDLSLLLQIINGLRKEPKL